MVPSAAMMNRWLLEPKPVASAICQAFLFRFLMIGFLETS
jgi:hypothetical protein